MADESLQHKLDRVRPPRVQITYDVDDGGAPKDKHLPFVVGIMADLSGDNEKNLPSLRDPHRKFVEIDRDNIDDIMADAAPALSYTVDNTLTGEGLLRVNLAFSKLEDLTPAAVANQVPALKELLDMRRRLDEALAKLSTNTQLEELLNQVLANQEKVHQLAREMGMTDDAEASAATEK
jgi:type VI secretion system protein ImpB